MNGRYLADKQTFTNALSCFHQTGRKRRGKPALLSSHPLAKPVFRWNKIRFYLAHFPEVNPPNLSLSLLALCLNVCRKTVKVLPQLWPQLSFGPGKDSACLYPLNKLIESRSDTGTTEKFRPCCLTHDTKCTRSDIKQFSANLLTLI